MKNIFNQDMVVLLESSRRDNENDQSYLFKEPEGQFSFYAGGDIEAFFDRIEFYQKKGKYLAGYFNYEFGYFLDSTFEEIAAAVNRKEPLACLGIYDSVEEAASFIPVKEIKDFKLDLFETSVSKEKYIEAIKQIKVELEHGNTYQINYTFFQHYKSSLLSEDIYSHLKYKQATAYNAYIKNDDHEIFSASPELFFRREGNVVQVKPMKGTRSRAQDPQKDHSLKADLQTAQKDRAENLMIVDLLRNDLGRISEQGTVKTEKLFEIEEHKTVYQMTSTISSSLRQDIKWFDIFKALFPCGSVTGAPKISSMKIINSLEEEERGVYCGAIGFIGPNNRACFNVPIRTLEKKEENIRLGIGSGVVIDSDAQAEYEECLIKSRFLLK